MSAEFYLGRLWDTAQNKILADKPLQYDPADLTTHGVVTGMTGSGKTGLCIGLLEEAALQGIPAIMIDPKGDLTNLLLHFPNLLPADFEPWIEADAARRQGKTTADVAAETAATWKKGLGDWGIQPERIAALKDAVDFTIYTPGSDAGIPVSIMASFQAPNVPWEGNKEILRERIASTVTAILGLVGLTDLDPVRSREHILLSNIFETAWSQGKSLDLAELIMQTQTPPFTKLGVFPVDSFFPEKDRFELAMLLNNFLAAPAFQTWMEGQPLDIAQILYKADGRPRHSIFYLAHLDDSERMFFVTLLYSAVETWMRTQSGTTSLRALLYFDEIVGYLPPIANPPAKPILLRMLKQARAFGVGLLLATQNPVDVDYKALSNAGTWFIGKLQTDQDKQRLLDGLSSASGALDRAEYDRLISGLGKRVFLMHNVHESKPMVFQTRWTMNYLAGPLTRTQIPALNKLVGAGLQEAAPAGAAATAATATAAPTAATAPAQAAQPVRAVNATGEFSATRPAVPSGVNEVFFPSNQTLASAAKNANQALAPDAVEQGIVYRPALFGQAQVRYLARQYQVDTEQRRSVLVSTDLEQKGTPRWDDFPYPVVDAKALEQKPGLQPRFAPLEAVFTDVKRMTAAEKDFLDWAFRTSALKVRANPDLKIYASPDVSQADFQKQTAAAVQTAVDAETEKVKAAYAKKIDALNEKINREQRELDQDEDELSQRKMEELGTAAESIFGLFTKGKPRVSKNLTKRRMTSQAKADVDESKKAIADMQKQAAALEAAQAKEVEEITKRWDAVAVKTGEITLNPLKKDVYVEVFGLAWLPYYQVKSGDKIIELPAFQA